MQRTVRLALVGHFALAIAAAGCGGAGDASDPEPADGGADGPIDAAAEARDGAPEAAGDGAPETIDVAPEAPIDVAPETASCPGEEPEPNDTEPEAVPLAAIDDCDSSGSALSGYLSSATDVDHWHYQGKDTVRCSVDPTASTKDPVELCVFVACLSGATQLNGCPSGAPATSHAKLRGCCVEGPGTVVVDFKCPLVGSGNDADVYLRVRSAAAKTCRLYDVAYHY